RNRIPALAALGERLFGFSARRQLPEWSSEPYRGSSDTGPAGGRNVVLLVDTFNRYFEPENAFAAERVLARAGYRVTTPEPAVGTAGAAAKAPELIPELAVDTFDATCCGMAGSFGLEAEHYEVSMKIGELGVLPRMRAAAPETLLAACGTSCRHQIAEGAGRQARHIVRILDEASGEPLSRIAGEGGAQRAALGG